MGDVKVLIGGSPCTRWSIAQTKNRETEASGIGWELFLNYRIARDKYQPDFFLYENNKSMSPAIRAQITAELGVEPVLINSALVSAQNRQRLYWAGRRNPDGTYSQVAVEQPVDRCILLRDILEHTTREKGYALKPLTDREMRYMTGDCGKWSDRWTYLQRPAETDKSCCITANIHRGVPYNVMAIPLRIAEVESTARPSVFDTSKQYCVYSPDAKGTDLCGNGGGMGAKTGLYAVPVIQDGKWQFLIKAAGGKEIPVYEVRGGYITIKGKTYPIKLADGFYIIRKLTVTECKRLQTVPDTYAFPVSDTQAYKMLGNGWTVDVIAHIMSYFTGLTEEPVEVLSMYDGMSCGHIALDKLGVEITAYYATEIDKYAVQTTQHNFPGTVQLGDAFQVRSDGWHV